MEPKKLNLKGGVGKSIALAREAKGLNQSELARAIGVSPQAVQKWEAGTSAPRPSKVAELAAFSTSIRRSSWR
ncbi:hypothetical protein AWV80_01290 [Cupriavidus sp. UYMU48A]|nr:hypothetical protein AWV80_01290 [Cupriavidus sp. UYMU48A]